MPRTVLVTRPEPGAARTASRILGLGLIPVVLPLSRIVSLPVQPKENWGEVTQIVATSANALRAAPAAVLAALRPRPLLVTGEATAEIAVAAGFQTVAAAGGTAGEIASHLSSRLPVGSHVLYLAGRVRRPELEVSLRRAGFVVETVEIYDTLFDHPSTETVLRLLGGNRVDVALIYSAAAGRALAALSRRDPLAKAFAATRYLSISARAAASLGPLGPSRLAIAERPDQDALIALLGRDC